MKEIEVEKILTNLLKEGFGLDLTDPNFKDTPARMARMYCREFLSGNASIFDDYAKFPNDKGYDQIVASDRIEFVSLCPHHFLPYTGTAWFFYIPEKWFIGASKPARLIEHLAKKPVLQETLCQEALEAFVENIKPQGAMVLMRGTHGCIACRGVKQPYMRLTTSSVYGLFRSVQELELKALSLISIPRSI